MGAENASCLVLRSRDRFKDDEILVLRRQLAVLQRRSPRPRFEHDDRAVFAALAPVLDRHRWSDCLLLTAALTSGHADIIEHGRWGRYNVILRLSHVEEKPLYFLADIVDADQTGAP